MRRPRHAQAPEYGAETGCPLDSGTLPAQYFDVLVSINSEVVDLETAMRNTKENLIRTAITVGNLIAIDNVR